MVFIWYLHRSYNGRKAKKHGLRFACESCNDNAFSCSFRKGNKKSSYENRNCLILNVAGPGHDPGTSGLWIRRSNQLSYPANTQFRLSHYCSNWNAGAKVSIIFEFCKFFRVFFLFATVFCGLCRTKSNKPNTFSSFWRYPSRRIPEIKVKIFYS